MHEGEQIPVPGKGENSWDCGEDATFSLSCPSTTISEAIGEMVKSCMRTRERYAGLDFKPEKPRAKRKRRKAKS